MSVNGEDDFYVQNTVFSTHECEPMMNLHFISGGDQIIGKLYENREGKLCFEGNIEESAKAFFEFLIKYHGLNCHKEPHR